jgi:hypothetical protein
MQKETVPPSHVYSAYGHALSGRISRPLDHIIDVQAGMSLPSIGGIGNARVEDFRFRDFVSFKAAYTHVAGSMSDSEIHTSLVTSTIEGLNVLDIVTADRVVTRLASRSKNHDPKEPQITLFGSKIDNLKIAGCAIHIDLANELFLELTTFESIRKEFDSNAKFRKIAADPFFTGKPKKSIDAHGVVVCSLVKDIEFNCPGVTRKGHALEVPEFGTIYIGEVFAQHRKRTVTMLRLELGCPVVGTVICAQAAGNGYPAG